ncbi:MAG: DUF4340 domain-containing protein [Candidatus Aminicenantes bacterium]|nr:DUF4340 domain-containing protein [Candidatus Aminicenantes bacterium]
MKLGKGKSETIILGAAIIAMLIYLALRNPDRMNYQLPRLAPIARVDISRVDIVRAGQTLRLEKKDNGWFIQPQGFSSDPAKANAIVDAIVNLRLAALVSESRNYSPYGLDRENAIVVKAYEKERLLREFSIGNAASTYSHTYVKLDADPRVFHARNSFRGDFDQKVDGLRDKTVLRFDKTEISAVEISTAAEKILFSKNAKPVDVKPNEAKPQAQAEPAQGETSWLMADGKPGNNTELNGIIEQTYQLSCEQFIAGKSKDDFKEPIYTVLLKGRKDFRLSIFQKAEKEISYTALSSESPYPFLLSSYTAENIMKKPEILKKETTASK